LLRTSASCGSLDVLNELLEYEEGCDVDLTNIEHETPLHLAVKYGEAELRALMVDSLLDAGAETRLGFIVTPSLSLSILMVPSVLKTRRAKWRGTTYVKMIRKREMRSAAMKLYVTSQRPTSQMVRVSPHRKCTRTDFLKYYYEEDDDDDYSESDEE